MGKRRQQWYEKRPRPDGASRPSSAPDPSSHPSVTERIMQSRVDAARRYGQLISRLRSLGVNRENPEVDPVHLWMQHRDGPDPSANALHVRRMFAGTEHHLGAFVLRPYSGEGQLPALPQLGSLQHLCLRRMAEAWEDFAEVEPLNLPALPARFKQILVHFLTLYGSRDCLHIEAFKMLWRDEHELDGATGSDGACFLDLTGLLNESFTLKTLSRYLTSRSGALREVSPETAASSSKGKQRAIEEVPDTWEDVADDSGSTVPPPLVGAHFIHLRYLSLAHPGKQASWPDLLDLCSHTSQITHLSLAHWPAHSVTVPNSPELLQDQPHIFTVMPAVLRCLSQHLYRLQSLDVAGTSAWARCLTNVSPYAEDPNDSPNARSRQQEQRDRLEAIFDGDKETAARVNGPDWNNEWAQVRFLRIPRACDGMVEHLHSLRVWPGNGVPCQFDLV